MGKATKPKRTKIPSKTKTEEITSSSGELASTLGNHDVGVIENHHHSPGGHGPDPDGSEMVDAAGDLHSDDRDVDDNEDAVEAVVETKTENLDAEKVGRIENEDEDIDESGRSFLDETATPLGLPESARPRHQTI